jgi:tetratricopeptide (TPR) repeat protein
MKKMIVILAIFMIWVQAQAQSTMTSPSSQQVQAYYSLIERANALYGQGRYPQAILMYRKAEKRGANVVITSFNIGNSLFRMDKLPEAAAAFRKAVRFSEEEYTPALFNLAAVLFRLEQYHESVAVYHRALRVDNKNAGAWLYLAEAYTRTGDDVGCQRALEKAMQLDNEDISIVYQLAETHVRMKEYNRAIELVRQAYARMPDENDFLIYIGDLYRLGNDPAGASASYREALASDPDNVDVLYKLADALAQDKKPFLAMDYLNKALAIRPEYGDALIFNGNLAYDNGWYDRAEELYATAAKIGNVEGLQGLKNIAWDYERRGDLPRAIQIFSKAVSWYPEDTELKLEIRRMQESS